MPVVLVKSRLRAPPARQTRRNVRWHACRGHSRHAFACLATNATFNQPARMVSRIRAEHSFACVLCDLQCMRYIQLAQHKRRAAMRPYPQFRRLDVCIELPKETAIQTRENPCRIRRTIVYHYQTPPTRPSSNTANTHSLVAQGENSERVTKASLAEMQIRRTQTGTARHRSPSTRLDGEKVTSKDTQKRQ